ncbi:hypothetical protein M5D96_002861 [Drosophila gunungcola]|uniref:Uncharacterized protein n=1 Tax=Drosophila gunungcola TaxID=103775 RepID=A0A9P9Z197_9MUSC|nr:hypothetical protein M5D96_002861 [Drosophila gunungcola]
MTKAGPYFDSRTRSCNQKICNHLDSWMETNQSTLSFEYNKLQRLTHFLYIRQADVESLVGIGKPHQSNVGHHKAAEVALVAGQVPDSLHLAVDLLIWQDDQLTRLNDGSAQLQVAILVEQFCCRLPY